MHHLVAVLFAAIAFAGGEDPPSEAPPAAVPADEAAAEDDAPAEDAAPGPITYRLDPDLSWLYVIVRNDPNRWTPVTGHDHGIRAMTFDGTVVWDPADPSACDVRIAFPVTALAVDPPGMRERAGLPPEGAIGEAAKRTVVNNMLGRSQLDAARFPEIRYRSSGCAPRPDGRVDVTGTLEVHGVGATITVPMAIEADAERFAARGSFELTHGTFGMKPFTYGPGTPRNQDRLEFHVDVVGAPAG